MSALDELDFTERVPATLRRDGAPEWIRVRGEASGPGAKMGSLLLSIPMMALTLVSLAGLGVALQRAGAGTRPEVVAVVVLSFAVLAMVVTAVLWGALSRMSSLGPTLWGLVLLALGMVLACYPSTMATLSRRVEGLPQTWRPGLAQTDFSLLPIVVGALLLGLAFAASLTRRAPRQYAPDAIGL